MRRLVICAALGAGCGGGDPPKAPSEPAAEPAPAVATPEPEPTPAGPSKADAERVDARTWWRHVAIGEIERAEALGDESFATIGAGPDARMIACPTASLEDAVAREAGYRDGMDALVIALRDERRRADAREQLEALTKTERGAWENWIGWHDQHGDFLVYNAELDRVDVDRARMEAGTPPVVGGLSLDVRLGSDRIGQDDPLSVTVRLKNVTVGDAAAPIVVNQRLALGHELKVEVRTHAPEDVSEVSLRPATDPGPPGPDDFTTLPPGASIDAKIDLAPRLASALKPGHYMVRLTYENAARQDGDAAWTGTLPSLRRFVRVVPW
jgi:hypothetical protein